MCIYTSAFLLCSFPLTALRRHSSLFASRSMVRTRLSGKRQSREPRVSQEFCSSVEPKHSKRKQNLPVQSSINTISGSNVHKQDEDERKSILRFVTFNVCSLRAILKTDVLNKLIDEVRPDVLALQETKMSEEAVAKLPSENILPGYSNFWCHSTTAKGHHGIATFIRQHGDLCVHEVTDTIGEDIGDGEGRVLTIHLYSRAFGNLTVVNTYVPNAGAKLARLEYRINTWEKKMRCYLASLREQNCNVMVLGDLNVAHQEVDIHDSKRNSKHAGHTPEERAAFSELLEEGWVDTFRTLYPESRDSYTFWSRRFGAATREKNKGWRLDYILVSKQLFETGIVQDTIHLTHVQGSDHAPVMTILQSKPHTNEGDHMGGPGEAEKPGT